MTPRASMLAPYSLWSVEIVTFLPPHRPSSLLGFGQPKNLNKNPGTPTPMNADKTWINADKMGDHVGCGGVRGSAHDGRKRRELESPLRSGTETSVAACLTDGLRG